MGEESCLSGSRQSAVLLWRLTERGGPVITRPKGCTMFLETRRELLKAEIKALSPLTAASSSPFSKALLMLLLLPEPLSHDNVN